MDILCYAFCYDWRAKTEAKDVNDEISLFDEWMFDVHVIDRLCESYEIRGSDDPLVEKDDNITSIIALSTEV